MATVVIQTRLRPHEARERVQYLIRAITGKGDDPHGLARGFGLRLGVAFLEKVKLAFIDKSRGGTDEAGIKWAPLSAKYLAYGRRFGPGEKAALKRGAGLGRANNRSPGGRDGLLTAAQEKQWWQIYRQNLAWLAATMPIGEAKARASAIAWKKLKAAGAKTKLDVYGSRQVEIGRDTGIMFNSLSVGELSTNGPDASYAPPDGQKMEARPGELIVGTNVPYAAAFHKRRPLWPEPDQIPPSWWEYFLRQAVGGIAAGAEITMRAA